MPRLSQRSRNRAASPRLVLVIVSSGVVLASIDLSIVNIALPQIAADFGVQDVLADLSWVLNAYAIVYAALLVLLTPRRAPTADAIPMPAIAAEAA